MEDLVRAFKAGDVCIVTGDSDEWDHRFPAGTEVTLESDDGSRAWLCRATKAYTLTHWDAGEATSTGGISGETWWVREADLELFEEPDEAEVLRLFGIQPTPHCTTCSCFTDKG